MPSSVKPRKTTSTAHRTQVKPPPSVRHAKSSTENENQADQPKKHAVKAPPGRVLPSGAKSSSTTPSKTKTKTPEAKATIPGGLTHTSLTALDSFGSGQVADLQRELYFLSFSRDLTRELVQSTGGVKVVMKEIFEKVLDALDAEAGSLWLTDEKSGTNVCHQAEGPAKDKILGIRLPLKIGIVGGVIANNQSDVVLNCASDQRFDSSVDDKSTFKSESMICVPLASEGGAFGAIQVINKRSGFQKRFAEIDRRLVEDMAMAASMAARNARLLESESRVTELSSLMEISQQISSSLDLNHVLDLSVNLTGNLVETSFSAIGLVDEVKDELFLAVLSPGGSPDPHEPWQKNLLELMEQVKKSGKVAYIGDVDETKKKEPESPWARYLEERGSRGAWATALTDEEGTLGVLWLESEESQFMSGNSSDMVTILANQTTVALRNASLFHRIPFADVLGKVGEKGKKWVSGWRRISLIALGIVVLSYGLHVLPVFRSVSGEALVESRFGQGVYLRVAGRIQETHVQEGQRVKKGQVIARLDDQPIRLKLVESESKLALLERQIVEAKAGSDAAAMSKAFIEKIAAQAELVQARRDIEQVEIRSPIDGAVLTPRPAELIGRDFPVGAEIIRVADPEQFTIVVTIPEEDVLDIHAGQSVEGVLRSRPGKGFRGEVIHVGRAYSVPAEALEEGVTDTAAPEGFVAEVKVLERDVDLLPGMTGNASISTPEVSVMTRLWRRVVNVGAFWFGLTLDEDS